MSAGEAWRRSIAQAQPLHPSLRAPERKSLQVQGGTPLIRRATWRIRQGDSAAARPAANKLLEKSIMTVFKYDHVHLRSPDPEATAQFYENMFGAEVSRSLYPAGTRFAGQPRITMKLGGTSFFVAPADPRTPNGDPPKAPHFGLEHIGLRVENLDAAAAELKGKGAHFTMEPVTFTPGTKIAFVQAPQGVLVELIQRDI
jgi:lactoylglutathione lyase